MAKKITVRDGHYEGEKIDHRSGKTSSVEHKVEERPVIDGYHNETVRDRYRFDRDFITMFTDDLYYLVKDGNMSLREWELFLYLCSTLNRGNATITNREVLAQELGWTVNQVSSNITKLKKRNLVIEHRCNAFVRDKKGPRAVIYEVAIAQLNYNIVFNGQTKDYKKNRYEHPGITMPDGQTLLIPQKEEERKKAIADKERLESLFDPETGEVWNTDEQ